MSALDVYLQFVLDYAPYFYYIPGSGVDPEWGRGPAPAAHAIDFLYECARANALYKSSLSTVQESNLGNLLKRFAQLPTYKCYIYGEKNKDVFPAEKTLKQEGIPLFYVPKSGHSMMIENPDEFYALISSIISQCTSKNA